MNGLFQTCKGIFSNAVRVLAGIFILCFNCSRKSLDHLKGSLYENFISGLLPEKQYKSLMKKYSVEQDSLESQVSEIQEKLEQTKASSAHIGRFIRLIRKYKQPTELMKEMACELIDKIVVHEAVGKKRWKKPRARKDDTVRAMLRIEPKPRRNAGRRMTVISTRSVSANKAARSFIRTAQGRDFATPIARKPISRQKHCFFGW